MYQKRRSTLGRRHLRMSSAFSAQPAHVEPTSTHQPIIDTDQSCSKSEKKKETNLDQPSKELTSKRQLFNKSPQLNYERCFFAKNVTGIKGIAGTPQLQAKPSLFTSVYRSRTESQVTSNKSKTLFSSVSKSRKKDILVNIDNNNHKRCVEIKRLDFDYVNPSGPFELDKPQEFPLHSDTHFSQKRTIEDPNTCLHFSPPLSSTCLGSPDCVNNINIHNLKHDSVASNVLKSLEECKDENEPDINQKDLDSSTLEFEEIERTMLDMEGFHNQSLLKTTPKEDVYFEKVVGNHNNYPNSKEKYELALKNILSQVDDMEFLLLKRAKENVKSFQIIHQQIDSIQGTIQNLKSSIGNPRKEMNEFKENMKYLGELKKSLKEFEGTCKVEYPFQNKTIPLVSSFCVHENKVT